MGPCRLGADDRCVICYLLDDSSAVERAKCSGKGGHGANLPDATWPAPPPPPPPSDHCTWFTSLCIPCCALPRLFTPPFTTRFACSYAYDEVSFLLEVYGHLEEPDGIAGEGAID
jgi:hypothetical protein